MISSEGSDTDPCGRLGLGLWRSPLRSLPCPPWAPRRDYASLSGGKAGSTGWRNLWILGGDAGGNHYLNDIWRTTDGGAMWEVVDCGAHWSPRSRLGVAGGQTASKRPIGVMYVVGGHGVSGFLADVWASDTAGRTWHRMNAKAPFGARAAVGCAVVSGEPLTLVVGGGMSVEVHRDLWLSRDGGETFGKMDIPGEFNIPVGFSLTPWPPEMLCATQTRYSGRLSFWKLRLGEGGETGKGAALEAFNEEDVNEALPDQVPRPPHVTMDFQAQVTLSWDSVAACLVAHSVPSEMSNGEGLFMGETDPIYLREVNAPGAGNAHVHCDMDSAFAPHWHGRVWILSEDGTRVWATDRARFRAQSRFLKLVGVRLQATHGFPLEVWGKVRAMLLPGPRRVIASNAEAMNGRSHAVKLNAFP